MNFVVLSFSIKHLEDVWLREKVTQNDNINIMCWCRQWNVEN